MNRFSQDALTRVVFILIGVVVGLLDFFIKRPNTQTDPLESIYKAFAVAAFLFIAELVLEIRDAQKREKKEYGDFVRRNRNLTGAVAAQVHGELERALRIHDGQFAVEHETLAIVSYDAFWRLLAEQVQTRKPLTVQTIHSCAIDVWVDHPLTASLLNRQREFCTAGGKICRILCDRSAEPQAHVLAAAAKMLAAGVEVRYYNLASRKIADHNFAWDFARVDETGDAAIWDSFANAAGGVIGEAVYVSSDEYRGKKLKDLWARVYAVSSPIHVEAQIRAVE